jgi:hypothetical protein
MKPALTCLFLLTCARLLAQPNTSCRADYKPIVSGNWLIDKSFYLLTAISKSPAVKAALMGEPGLKQTLTQRVASINRHATITARSVASLMKARPTMWTTLPSTLAISANWVTRRIRPKNACPCTKSRTCPR